MKEKKYVIHSSVKCFLLLLISSACVRNVPTQGIDIQFPSTSTISQTPTTTPIPQKSTENLVSTEQNKSLPMIVEMGYMGNEILIIKLQLPDDLQGEEMWAWVDGQPLDCLYQDNQTFLYCSGPVSGTESAILKLQIASEIHTVFEIPIDP